MKFCTSIQCMDGRIQKPVIDFILDNYDIEFVDVITEPGPIKILTELAPKDLLYSILRRINITIEKHRSRLIFLSGHFDCLGNPVNEEKQKQQLKKSINYLERTYPGIQIEGLWIDNKSQVNPID